MHAELLADARARIHARGELPLPTRIQLRQMLTELVGPRAWAELEAAAARRVRQVWDARFGREDLPWLLLDDALAALRAGTVLPDTNRRLGECWVLLLDAHQEPDFRPTYAGFAAFAAARVAAHDAGPVNAASELEMEVEEWDACFFASLAASGGAVWEEDEVSDDSLRRAFWEWYLDEAGRIGRSEGRPPS